MLLMLFFFNISMPPRFLGTQPRALWRSLHMLWVCFFGLMQLPVCKPQVPADAGKEAGDSDSHGHNRLNFSNVRARGCCLWVRDTASHRRDGCQSVFLWHLFLTSCLKCFMNHLPFHSWFKKQTELVNEVLGIIRPKRLNAAFFGMATEPVCEQKETIQYKWLLFDLLIHIFGLLPSE